MAWEAPARGSGADHGPWIAIAQRVREILGGGDGVRSICMQAENEDDASVACEVFLDKVGRKRSPETTLSTFIVDPAHASHASSVFAPKGVAGAHDTTARMLSEPWTGWCHWTGTSRPNSVYAWSGRWGAGTCADKAVRLIRNGFEFENPDFVWLTVNVGGATDIHAGRPSGSGRSERGPVLSWCGRCGRQLTDEESARLGYGPHCAEELGFTDSGAGWAVRSREDWDKQVRQRWELAPRRGRLTGW